MEISTTKLPGVFVITPNIHQDERGFFYELYQEKNFFKGLFHHGSSGLKSSSPRDQNPGKTQNSQEVKTFEGTSSSWAFSGKKQNRSERDFYAYSQKEVFPLFLQDNISYSKKNVLRGLHYQAPPKAQGKLVQVLQGAVLDVVVDVGKSSSTYGQWVTEVLSFENHKQLWIPPGFAHGFLTLSEEAVFLYKTTEYWSKEHERSLLWNDPTLGIPWPLQEEPILSEKDRAAPLFESI